MADKLPAGPNDLPALPRNLTFVSRTQWGSEELEDHRDDRQLPSFPLEYVRFTTTEGKSCNSTKQCCIMLKEIQKKAREEYYQHDVPYNFLVDESGVVYEGRGWFREAERPERYKYLAGKTVDIAYFGEYGKKIGKPTHMATKAAEVFVRYGVDAGLIKFIKKEVGYND